MCRAYWTSALSPSPAENLLANRPSRSNPIKVAKSIQSVPKKIKIVHGKNEEPIEPSALSAEAKIGKVTPRPASTSRKNGKPAHKKSATARKTKMPKERAGMRMAAPSDEEIRLRAYFISERRRRFDLAGNASSDWLEAKRQLLSESGPR
jgi:hypothetical protein